MNQYESPDYIPNLLEKNGGRSIDPETIEYLHDIFETYYLNKITEVFINYDLLSKLEYRHENLIYYLNKIYYLPNLERLVIRDIIITKEEIVSIAKLNYNDLDIQGINISEKHLRELLTNKRLKKLNIRHLRSDKEIIMDFTKFDVSKLNILILQHDKFKKFPIFSKFDNLRILELDNNKIESIPSLINKLPLEELYLGNNFIKNLPNELGFLKNLKNLYLENNDLFEIPSSFKNLDSLYSINLSSNKSLKLETLKNLPSNLKCIILKNMNIYEIPESLKSLRNLRILHLESNYIQLTEKDLEIITELKDLKALYLSNNSSNVSKGVKYLQRHLGTWIWS